MDLQDYCSLVCMSQYSGKINSFVIRAHDSKAFTTSCVIGGFSSVPHEHILIVT